jgi:hypothetical protein
MLALKVEVDGQPFTVAGTEDWAVLSTQIEASRDSPNGTAADLSAIKTVLKIGAVSHPDKESMPHHSRWGTLDLGLGSTVKITIIDTQESAPPI